MQSLDDFLTDCLPTNTFYPAKKGEPDDMVPESVGSLARIAEAIGAAAKRAVAYGAAPSHIPDESLHHVP